jgi:gamma-glutamylcyclotransferase (GGCT)/AIG2-like uncharacterized protein YtfP
MSTLQPPPLQDLFTYGSLMCEDIMASVGGARLTGIPAILPGFRRFLVRDEQYPGVVAEDAGTVAGLVYHRISPAGWSRLDAFEGEMYERRPVTVHLESGAATQVYCYVFRPEFHHRLTTEQWDYAAFLRNGKQLFQRQYCGFKTISADQVD